MGGRRYPIQTRARERRRRMFAQNLRRDLTFLDLAVVEILQDQAPV